MMSQHRTRVFQELSDQPGIELRKLWRRATVQIDFAEAFADLPVNSGESWKSSIRSASKLIEEFDTADGLVGLTERIAAAELELSSIGIAAKQYRIHCVGHGHIDMNWMWSWPETVAITHDTFASVLALMRRYKDITYSQSQTAIYVMIEKYHPAMFEEIKQRVKEGRWEITASQWVEGDKNLAAGESLCRHLQMSREYIQMTFGLSAEDLPIDWEPDTFGHANSVPAILRQGGIKYYYSCRTGGGHEVAQIGNPRPRLFRWASPDGSSVLVNHESTWYNSYINMGENIALPPIDFVRETGLHEWLNVFGMGNHGGGPTCEEIDWLLELQELPCYPTIEFSTAKRYFDLIDAEINTGQCQPVPVLAQELNFEFTGCYTSQSLIKQANRFGENYLIETEPLALISSAVLNTPYPHSLLDEAWKKVLFNQFHDILPGSGIRQTREHALAQFQEVGASTGAIKRQLLNGIGSRINTVALIPDSWVGTQELRGSSPIISVAGFGQGVMETGLSEGGGTGRWFRPFVVFNSCAWDRSQRVTVNVYDSNFDPSVVVAVDDQGRVQPVLALSDPVEDWGHRRVTISFNAEGIPAMGYRTYIICEKDNLSSGVSPSFNAPVVCGRHNSFTTPFLSFEVEREYGGLSNLADRRTGARLSQKNAKVPIAAIGYVVEESRDMEAWLLGRELNVPNALTTTSFEIVGRATNIGTHEVAPVAPAGCQVKYTLPLPSTTSKVRVTMNIHALEPRVDFTAEIDWREIGSSERGIPGLTLLIPLALAGITARYETPFSSISRSLFDGEEVPSLRYAHVEGTATTESGEKVYAGVTLLQDCKYGHSIIGNDIDGHILRLRLVRSSFAPDPTPEIAVSTTRFSLYFHDQPTDIAELTKLSAAWNQPLITLPVGIHNGDLPASKGFAKLLTCGVVLTSLKQAQSGEGIVLRLSEMNGQNTAAEVEIDGELLKGLHEALIVDLMERPTGIGADLKGNKLTVSVPANSFVTVLIR
jgi:alpha-mannosidase